MSMNIEVRQTTASRLFSKDLRIVVLRDRVFEKYQVFCCRYLSTGCHLASSRKEVAPELEARKANGRVRVSLGVPRLDEGRWKQFQGLFSLPS
jgi:hypothetical protein